MADKLGVLVIDDDVNIRNVIKNVLKKEYDVHLVSNVEDALLAVEYDERIKVVIVDYQLDGETGDEFIKQVPAESCSHIMITGREIDSDFVAERIQEGALYVLKKPFSLVELKAMVNKAAEGRQSCAD